MVRQVRKSSFKPKPRKQFNRKYHINSLYRNTNKTQRKFLYVKINNRNINLQLDTGSDITLSSENTWKTIWKPSLQKIFKITHGVLQIKLIFKGKIICNITFQGKTGKANVYL